MQFDFGCTCAFSFALRGQATHLTVNGDRITASAEYGAAFTTFDSRKS
ncbi:hypothetical protein EBESD8_18840 [Rhodococcus aetherivorans]|nr:hypothetical protein EBESD8_18840 [Rhodococcus aetherivorans]